MNSISNIKKPNHNKVLHFIVQNVQMCLYLNSIHKVLPLVELQDVPSAPNYLVGLMNLNGQSIPVIDLAIRTGLPRKNAYSLETPILLCENDGTKIGLVVDKIIGLSDINESSLQNEEEFKKPGSYFLASLVEGAQSSLLLNTQNVLINEFIGKQHDNAS